MEKRPLRNVSMGFGWEWSPIREKNSGRRLEENSPEKEGMKGPVSGSIGKIDQSLWERKIVVGQNL